MRFRKLKLFREKHGISLAELSRSCGLTRQRLDYLERSETTLRRETESKILLGLERVIQSRQTGVEVLTEDYEKQKASLMETVEETEYE